MANAPPPPPPPRSVAVIGCGVAGLGAAYALSRAGCAVTLYEASPTLGGHANTVLVGGRPIDTGFLVFNEDTYPNLLGLFEELGVPTEPSDMSFSVSLAGRSFEWSSNGLSGLLAQPSNAFSPDFRAMLSDMARFNAEAPAFLAELEGGGGGPALASTTLRKFLDKGGYSTAFRNRYLLPQVAAVWSASGKDALDFPARTLLRFMANHSLLQAVGRPQWRTVSRRSREYVRRIAAALDPQRTTIKLSCKVSGVARVRVGGGLRVRVTEASSGAVGEFDGVVFGCHPDEALVAMGSDASEAERGALGGFKYARNIAYLHTDLDHMPKLRSCWASWNYMGKGEEGKGVDGEEPCCVSYWLNKLQNLPEDVPPLFVTLNPATPPCPDRVLRTFDYSHPQYSGESVAAQEALHKLQGKDGVWWAGAYLGYGFHEDGLTAGLRAGMGGACGSGGGVEVHPPWWAATLYNLPVEPRITEAVLLSHGAGGGAAAEVDLCKRSGGPFWVDNLGNGGPVGAATTRLASLLASQRAALAANLEAVGDPFGGRVKRAAAGLPPPPVIPPDALRGTTAAGDVEGFVLQSPDDVLFSYKLLIGAEKVGAGGVGGVVGGRAWGGVSAAAASAPLLGTRNEWGVITESVAASLQGRRALKDARAGTAILAALQQAAGSIACSTSPSALALLRAAALLPSSSLWGRLRTPLAALMAGTRGGYTAQHPPLQPPPAPSAFRWAWHGAYALALRAGASPVLSYLQSSLVHGAVLLRTPDGEERVFGDPSAEAPLRARLRVHSWAFFFRVATESDLGLARSFMAGEWSTDDLTALFNVFIANRDRAAGMSTYGLWTAWVGLTVNFLTYATRMDNSVANSQSNISAHYDLSNDLFASFLDPRTMMYSCGFFDAARRVTKDTDLSASASHAGGGRLTHAQGLQSSLCSVPIGGPAASEAPREHNAALRALGRNMATAVPSALSAALPPVPSAPGQERVELLFRGSLEAAQLRKLDHLIARAGVTAKDRVLDLGFGWGGLSIRLAEVVGCRVHGITLSKEQHDLAAERVAARGLGHLITFEIVDYRVFARDHPGEFDKIISVEMVEAVGHNYFPSFMGAIDRLLAPGGVVVVQAIMMPEGRYKEYLRTCDFINTIIFPGGELRNFAFAHMWSLFPCCSV